MAENEFNRTLLSADYADCADCGVEIKGGWLREQTRRLCWREMAPKLIGSARCQKTRAKFPVYVHRRADDRVCLLVSVFNHRLLGCA